MTDKMRSFLAACKEAGITRVAVGVSHKSVPQSVSFPFGPCGSVFQFPSDLEYPRERNFGGWPAIWWACEKAGVNCGCGNPDQHNFINGSLKTGVYHLKDGKWVRLKEPKEKP